MKLGQFMRMAKLRVHNLAASRDEEAMLAFINMGMIELYRRFDLSIKSETVMTNPQVALYTLKNDDVMMLLGLFDANGRELRQTDVIDSKDFEAKIINYRSFLLRKPEHGYIYAVYKASAIELVDSDDYIDLPDAMLDALLAYISYAANYTINKDNMNEADMFFQRFQAICQSLENQGYKIPANTERIALAAKGFV